MGAETDGTVSRSLRSETRLNRFPPALGNTSRLGPGNVPLAAPGQATYPRRTRSDVSTPGEGKGYLEMRKVCVLFVLAAAVQLAAAQITYVFEGDQLAGPESYTGTGYVEFTLQNSGLEGYDLLVVRLGEGKTAEDYTNALEALIAVFQAGGDSTAGFAALAEAGRSVGDVSAEAGASGTVGLVLDPGSYLLSGSCASCSPNQQLVSLVIEDGPRAEVPAADVTVAMTDFLFSGLPTELEAGPKVWDVANTGDQGHLFILVKLAEGATFEEFTAWLATPEAQGGEVPERLGADVPGAAHYIDPGGRYFETLDLSPGSYVLVCPVPDPASGQPHYHLGMVHAVTVN